MVARVGTVAFQGIEVVDVDVQVQMAAGLPTLPGLLEVGLHSRGKDRPSEDVIKNIAELTLLAFTIATAAGKCTMHMAKNLSLKMAPCYAFFTHFVKFSSVVAAESLLVLIPPSLLNN